MQTEDCPHSPLCALYPEGKHFLHFYSTQNAFTLAKSHSFFFTIMWNNSTSKIGLLTETFMSSSLIFLHRSTNLSLQYVSKQIIIKCFFFYFKSEFLFPSVRWEWVAPCPLLARRLLVLPKSIARVTDILLLFYFSHV